jgi:AcrR family transcriptional regulator
LATPRRSLLVRKVRRFKQQRSAATYEALLRAAARVFAEHGFDGAQTPDIATAAGVSTGAFYRYFDDKKQIFLEVLTDHLTRGRQEVQARLTPDRFAPADSRIAVEVVLDVLFETVKQNAALHRVFLAMSLTDSDVADLRAEFEAEDRAALAQLIGNLVPREAVPNPTAAAEVIQASALEVAIHCAGLRRRKGAHADSGDVKRALGDMLYRYLFAPQQKRAASAH